MIHNEGIRQMLSAFVSKTKETKRVNLLELGIGDHTSPIANNDPFDTLHRFELNSDQVQLVGMNTIQVTYTLNGNTLLEGGETLTFSTIRVMFENGETFATRRFIPRILTNEFRAEINWHINLSELCWNSPNIIRWDNIVNRPESTPSAIDYATTMIHEHPMNLDKFGEISNDRPTYGDDDVVQIIWNKE